MQRQFMAGYQCSRRKGAAMNFFPFEALLLTLILLLSSFQDVNCDLSTKFYAKTCPSVEDLVQNEVSTAILKDHTIAGGLLRMLFHDCFVQGCDASVLLDSVNGSQAEKDAFPNLSLRGFEVIDGVKTRVEAACPGIVSCADILAFAARDSVVQMGGQFWAVSSGRRDGLSSNAGDANANLPSFASSVAQLVQTFQAKGLTPSEMVTLSGAHTIGAAACSSFSDRLYRFNGTFSQDPSLNPQYAETLKSVCPNGGSISQSNVVNLDPSTPDAFDNMFYQNIMGGRGLLQSDQAMSTDPETKGNVRQLAGNNTLFLSKFTKAMVKMSAIDVKTGTQGQVRLNCRTVNP